MPRHEAYHATSAGLVVAALEADPEAGLSAAEAARRLVSHGPNVIPEKPPAKPFVILLKQLGNPMAWLLFAAAGLSFAFGEWLDGTAIAVVILINTLIGFWMEWQAERSMDALRRMTAVTARVLRSGTVRELPSEDVVPGDILAVEAGDLVAADARLLSAAQLGLNESALTGESLPAEKAPLALPGETTLAERKNMLYKGTFVNGGNGRAVVTATGLHTELGSIAGLVQAAERPPTPLEKKLQAFSRKLIGITVVLAVAIFAAGLLNGAMWQEMLKTAIALAVAAIPEGLPVVATLALARGMLKMARQHVIVKKLAAVETLGGTTVICTDKTGTLTQNRVEVSVLDLPGGMAEIRPVRNGSPLEFIRGKEVGDQPAWRHLRDIAVLCSTADYSLEGTVESAAGDPLETGLLRFAHHAGTDVAALRKQCPKTEELPFSSETKLMATKHACNGSYRVAAKGAAEELLKRCTAVDDGAGTAPLTEAQRQAWAERAERMAAGGLKVLGFGYKEAGREDGLTDGLVFAGLAGFIDPPAPGVKEAVGQCRQAGIGVVMITGDHPATALAVARDLGLAGDGDTLIHGKDMKPAAALSDNDRRTWLDAKIFARVSPAQKLDLVTVLQEYGNVVGMTGDGVNDAPALRKADIGIAMGIRGTQVAQEAADMVLRDDSFASIVSAVRQGRVIFGNIRKSVIYLISSNISELILVAGIALAGLHFQLFPLQILFINLVSDVLPALALGTGKGGPLIMKRPPARPDEPVITGRQWRSVWAYAAVIALFTVLAVAVSHYVLHPHEPWNRELCNNVLFLTLIAAQLLHVFNMAPGETPFHRNEVFTNRYVWYSLAACLLLIFLAWIVPPARQVLHLHAVSAGDALTIAGAAAGSMIAIRMLKKGRWVE